MEVINNEEDDDTDDEDIPRAPAGGHAAISEMDAALFGKILVLLSQSSMTSC
jgi:hypothetical protein